jgi:2'-5' RNA ligase
MARRMFIAIDLPPPLAGNLSNLDPHLPNLRWLPASALHLTLCFLGNVPDETAEPLIQALDKIDSLRFPLVLQNLGSFGSRSRPSVVWAGLETCPSELSTLHHQIQAATRAAGLQPDAKRFHPHITLGRCKDLPGSALQPFLRNHAEKEFGRFEVTGFTLYHSILHPGGAEHFPVFEKAFSTTPDQ